MYTTTLRTRILFYLSTPPHPFLRQTDSVNQFVEPFATIGHKSSKMTTNNAPPDYKSSTQTMHKLDSTTKPTPVALYGRSLHRCHASQQDSNRCVACTHSRLNALNYASENKQMLAELSDGDMQLRAQVARLEDENAHLRRQLEQERSQRGQCYSLGELKRVQNAPPGE